MRTYFRGCAVLCLFMVLAGCALPPLGPDAFNASLEAAAKKVEQGQIEQGVAALHDLAKRNPERAEPWAYIAKTRFDEKKYSLAIVAAEEALRRDDTDAGSHVVLANSAMHIAAESVADMKGNTVLTDTTRDEAKALAQALRETYRNEDLFPAKHKAVRRNVRPATSKPANSNRSSAGGALADGASGDSRTESVNLNPFGSLLR